MYSLFAGAVLVSRVLIESSKLPLPSSMFVSQRNDSVNLSIRSGNRISDPEQRDVLKPVFAVPFMSLTVPSNIE